MDNTIYAINANPYNLPINENYVKIINDYKNPPADYLGLDENAFDSIINDEGYIIVEHPGNDFYNSITLIIRVADNEFWAIHYQEGCIWADKISFTPRTIDILITHPTNVEGDEIKEFPLMFSMEESRRNDV